MLLCNLPHSSSPPPFCALTSPSPLFLTHEVRFLAEEVWQLMVFRQGKSISSQIRSLQAAYYGTYLYSMHIEATQLEAVFVVVLLFIYLFIFSMVHLSPTF